MRALIKTHPGVGNVSLDTAPKPEPAAGQALLHVLAAGVCGTDLHLLDDEFRNKPPVILGHEVAGRVVAVGAEHDRPWLGSRVATETYFYTCGMCRHCQAGSINLCPKRESIGSLVDGGFAEFLTVPVRNLHRVPNWLSDQAATLCEPLACVCQCLTDPAVISPGDEVLVIGPGTMGLLSAQVARTQGGGVTVVGTAHDTVRLAAAADLGFNAIVASELRTATPHSGFPVVVECSGSDAGVASGLEAIARKGRYIQVGLCGKKISFDIDEICYREVTITSGFASTPTSWRRAMTLINTEAVQLEPLITEIAPLDDWQRVFDMTRRGQGIKFAFNPSLPRVEPRIDANSNVASTTSA